MFDRNQLSVIRATFTSDGLSVADWARARNFSLPLVYAVLTGRSKGTRGESHRIAVALGLKPKTQQTLPEPSTQVVEA
ncbi:MAG: DNA-binding protein [Rhodoferax sp.]|nr:DNA-binding protein [Rhodoferax sp.]